MNKKTLIILGVVVSVILVWALLSKGKGVGLPSAGGISDPVVRQLYEKANAFKQDNEFQKAKEVYQEILTNYPNYENIEMVNKDLEAVNVQMIFSNVESPRNTVHEVQAGDSLAKLAKKYNTTAGLIRKKNNLKSDVIRAGQKLYIWNGAFNIFVDKSQNILMLKDNDDVIKVYRVSTGENNSTPTGKFKVTTKLVDPVWFNKGVVVPPESPQNVLGSRWLGFDLAGYGIHGTIEPETIGSQVTAGCVRMRNEDVEELYDLITLGTEVVIVD